MNIALVIGAAVLGAAMGSFAVAQVWRLRARQLAEDKKVGHPVDAAEMKRLRPLLKAKKLRQDRSVCLSCGHQLEWYDLLPVVSWVSLGGRCRYCRQPIGWTEVLAELGLGGLFALSVCWWPWAHSSLSGLLLSLWLVALVLLTILFIYDLKWYLLPDVIMLPLIIVAIIFAALQMMQSTQLVGQLWSLIGAIGLLAGLYTGLYLLSGGAWVGFGDVKLGLGLALLLGHWPLAFLTLFLANLLGTLIVLPGILRGVLQRTTKIPFGPLLIAGFLIAWFCGRHILAWYMALV